MILRTTVFCAFLFLVGRAAFSQRIASDVIKLTSDAVALSAAEEAMINVAENRDSLPAHFACFARAQVRSSRSNGANPKLTDYFLLQAKNEFAAAKKGKAPYSYFAIGIKSLGEVDTQNVSSTLWDQHLKVGTTTLRRWGFANKYDSKTDVGEDGNLVGSSEVSRPILKHVDVYNLPLADYGSFSAGLVDERYSLQFLEVAQLVRAGENDQEIIGVWKSGDSPGAFTIVTFSKAHGGMPTKVVWRVAEEDIDESIKKGRTYSLSTTHWSELEIPGRGDPCWLPLEVRLSSAGHLATSTNREIHFLATWMLGEKASACIPQPQDEDWREPCRKTFNENFSVGFDEFVAASRKEK